MKSYVISCIIYHSTSTTRKVTQVHQELVICRPDNFHTHLRDGELMDAVVPHTAKHFKRALVMPNTEPPILNAEDAMDYYEEIMLIARATVPDFVPLMTIKLTMDTTAPMIWAAASNGVIAAKLYPTGATTNSEDGVDIEHIHKLEAKQVFSTMVECGMVLCVHAEDPRCEVLDREVAMIEKIQTLHWMYPKLKIVVEHVSTAKMAQYITQDTTGNLGATVTAHHLYLTLDDLAGGKLAPHYFCKPILKQNDDREVLWLSVEDSPNFFFGSDSAPHPLESKHSDCCAAGAFTDPIALPLLADMFEARDILDVLEAFTSERGAEFYGLARNSDTITLAKRHEPIEISDELIGGCKVMPLKDGHELYWEVAS